MQSFLIESASTNDSFFFKLAREKEKVWEDRGKNRIKKSNARRGNENEKKYVSLFQEMRGPDYFEKKKPSDFTSKVIGKWLEWVHSWRMSCANITNRIVCQQRGGSRNMAHAKESRIFSNMNVDLRAESKRLLRELRSHQLRRKRFEDLALLSVSSIISYLLRSWSSWYPLPWTSKTGILVMGPREQFLAKKVYLFEIEF